MIPNVITVFYNRLVFAVLIITQNLVAQFDHVGEEDINFFIFLYLLVISYSS